jgi:hypothetical protein
LKYLTSILLLSITLAAVPATLAQKTKPKPEPELPSIAVIAPEWGEYVSHEGRFSVQLPGTPKEEIKTTSGSTTMHVFTLLTPIEFEVIYADYPFAVNDPETAQQMLDAGAKNIAPSLNAELLNIEKISLGDIPGRALKLRLHDGYSMRIKVYLVGSRIYQLFATLPPQQGTNKEVIKDLEREAAKFLNSFKPLDTNAPGDAGTVDELLQKLPDGSVVVGRCDGPPCKNLPDAVVEFKVTYNPPPTYPPAAKAAHSMGKVVVKLVFDEAGRVIAAQAESGPALLKKAAVDAARGLRIEPVTLDGKPVKVLGVRVYNFVLQ